MRHRKVFIHLPATGIRAANLFVSKENNSDQDRILFKIIRLFAFSVLHQIHFIIFFKKINFNLSFQKFKKEWDVK